MKKNKTLLIVSLVTVTGIVFGGILLSSHLGYKVVRFRPVELLAVPSELLNKKLDENGNTPPPILPKVAYTEDGKLDTRDWVEYRSEYGGFSVRGPRELTGLGCYGHGCEPARDGERLQYTLVQEDGPGIPGMQIYSIKKIEKSNLNNWIDTYIVSGNDAISNIQKVSIKGSQALQFDIQSKEDVSIVNMTYSTYPYGSENSENSGNIGGYPSLSYRFLIIDGGDRYIIIYFTSSIDNVKFLEYLNKHGYSGPLTPSFFNNKTLSDIYQAILDSLEVFPPTKS